MTLYKKDGSVVFKCFTWNHSWAPSTILHYWILPEPSDEKADCQNIWYNFITSNNSNLWECSTESQYSFHFENIYVPLVSSSPQKPHLCTRNIYRFIECLCVGSHNAGMLPYVHVGRPKSRQLSVLVTRTVIISRRGSASSLRSPTLVPTRRLWLVGTFCSAVGLHLPQCTDL